MKVILLENVRKIGSIGEIIEVKRGFARKARNGGTTSARSYRAARVDDYRCWYCGASDLRICRFYWIFALHGLDRRKRLDAMIYVLVFLHFVNGDNLKYYQIKTFSDYEECQLEAKKAKVMITHSSMTVRCLEISGS